MLNNVLSNRQTIEQRRASKAWDAIGSVPRNRQPQYGSLVRGFAAMIQVNGLAASVAFLRAKAGREDNEHMLLYRHLGEWLKAQIKYTQTGLIEFIKDANTEDYRRATAEAMEYAIWLKRFVEAEGWKSSED